MIVEPGSPLPGPPVTVSVVSLVTRSPAMPVSWETESIVGAAGVLASIVHVPMVVDGDWLPAVSVTATLSGYWPSANALVVTLYDPSGCTVAVPTATGDPLDESYTVIVVPGSALPGPPVTVSVVSLVIRSPGVPVSCDTEPTVGAAGAVASIVQVPMLVGCDSFPAASTRRIANG